MSTLENRYSNMFGSKTSKGQLYGGFVLLIGGMFIGVVALILFFVANSSTGSNHYDWMKGPLALALLFPIMILLGTSTALPTKTVMRVLSYVGALACVVGGLICFVQYPNHINVHARAPTQADYLGVV